jgi:hypothetical protein
MWLVYKFFPYSINVNLVCNNKYINHQISYIYDKRFTLFIIMIYVIGRNCFLIVILVRKQESTVFDKLDFHGVISIQKFED